MSEETLKLLFCPHCGEEPAITGTGRFRYASCCGWTFPLETWQRRHPAPPSREALLTAAFWLDGYNGMEDVVAWLRAVAEGEKA